MTSGGILHVSARDAFALIKSGVILVDLRPEHEVAHKSFDVPGVIRCPYYEFEDHLDLLPADQAVIIADAVGIHSKAATLLLIEKGYQNIANLAGGFVDWEREGFPIKVDSSEALSGPCLCMLRPMRKGRGDEGARK
jgi:rhodanese-related sulfurtransferase